MRPTAGFAILALVVAALLFEVASAAAAFETAPHRNFCAGYALCD